MLPYVQVGVAMSDFAPSPSQPKTQPTSHAKQVDNYQTSRPVARWQVRPVAPPEACPVLIGELEIPPLLASVLWARGFREDVLEALEPPLTLTQIPDLDAAAARLEAAIRDKKRITIHGDYDADGITGTAILTLGLRELGAKVRPFIPHRVKEGYGISPERVPEHIKESDLFVTVDCGISNLPEIADMQAAGVEVIVSDHHHPGQDLPDCLIVHPKMSPLAQAGMPELTGAGVAYHLLWALRERLGLEAPLDYSDLASIGIIADVAPLMGENRALVTAGLAQLTDSRWAGIAALIKQTGLQRDGNLVTATDVAFVLAPRLNAAGRMGDAELGLELLMTASERRARELAVYLQTRNSERKDVQNAMFTDAMTHVDSRQPAIVVSDDSWHAGVMGIVASKLLERFFKPVFIIAGDKGSVRSIPGISAVNALQHAKTTLKRFGGHSQAAGFALEPSNIPAFRDAINDFVAQHPTPQPVTTLDTLISPSEMTWDVLTCLKTLEPFGQGHRAPLFGFCGQVDAARAVGKDATHLQLRVSGVKGIAWQRGDQAETLQRRDAVNVAISLRENEWRGVRSIEFEAQDVRQAEPLELTNLDKLGTDNTYTDNLGTEDTYTDKLGTDNLGTDNLGADDTYTDGTHHVTIKRSTPPANANTVHITTLEDIPQTPHVWHLTALLTDDSLTPTDVLQQGLAHATAIYIELSMEELQRLEHLAATFPDVGAVRRAYVQVKRGTFQADGMFAERCLVILRELDLVDDLGRAKTGVKRNPYTSKTLEKGLLEQYRLRRFVQAYQYLADTGFARAFHTLFLAS